MDPRYNPYTPNVGAKPPVLAGRATELDAFDVLLSRLERGATEQSMIVTGLRGVGKTVLLGEFRRRSEARSWVTIEAEMTKGTEFGARSGCWPGALCCRSRPGRAGATGLSGPPE